MLKLAVLVVAICIHVSFAGHPDSKPEPEGNGDQKAGVKDMNMIDDSTMEKMMMKQRKKMEKMLAPMRSFYTEVLGLGPRKNTGKPAFCGDLDCPKFTVDTSNTNTNYEVRNYVASQWVCTNNTVDFISRRVKAKAFFRLFKYIRGNNKQNQKIKMTAPVTMFVKPAKAAGKQFLNMCFYISSNMANPPKPNCPTVNLRKELAYRVYVHTFDGFAMQESIWMHHAMMLEKLLDQDKRQYVAASVQMIGAGYDEPMKFFNRHNEVWLFAE